MVSLRHTCGRSSGKPIAPKRPTSRNTSPTITSTGPSRFGDYELLEVIASGGMGTVWRARQISLGRVVALKLLRAGEFAKPAEEERFRSEAAAVASLQHPHIVALHDFGKYEGQPWFSMEFIEGQTLAHLVRDKPLPPNHAAELLKTIAEAISYAHSCGILHRDIKPSNILLDQQSRPRITDFGLAKKLKDSALCTLNSSLTLSGQLLGTPNYAPPEQLAVRRANLGPPSDVYGLGAVLYEMLTGRPPFAADTLEATLLQVIDAEPTPPRQLNPAVPSDLETICLKCLEKAPTSRYATAQALADELGRYLRAEPILARPIGALGRFGRWCKRKPALATTCALALVLFATLGTLTISGAILRAEKRRHASSGLAVPVKLQNATATFSQTGFPVGSAIDGNTASGGWAIYESSGISDPTLSDAADHTHAQTAVFETASDVGYSEGSLLTFTLIHKAGNQQTIGRFRLSATTDARSTFANGLASGGDVAANWVVLMPRSFSAASGTPLGRLDDGSILTTGGEKPAVDTYTITVPTALVGITGVRLETLSSPLLSYYGPGNHLPDGNFLLTELQLEISSASRFGGGLRADFADRSVVRQVFKFVETEFADTDWEFHVLSNHSSIRADKTQVSENSEVAGLTGTYQRTAHNMGGSQAHSELLSVQINSRAIYSPGAHGTISHLDFSADCRTFATEFNTYGGHLAPALKQNGLLYLAKGFFRTTRDDHTSSRLPSPWKEIRIPGLRQTDFTLVTGPMSVDGTQNPDFSINAPPIVFGYALGNTHTSSDVVTRQVDIDNWTVAVYSRSPSRSPSSPPP